MTDVKLCNKCGEKPRKVSKSGKMLTMCDECQREDWRQRKAKKNGYRPRENARKSAAAATPEPFGNRVCEACEVEKPVEDFPRRGRGVSRVCADCLEQGRTRRDFRSKDKPPASVYDKPGVAIRHSDGTVGLYSQVSRVEAKHPDMLIDMYAQMGYEVWYVAEREQAAAGD